MIAKITYGTPYFDTMAVVSDVAHKEQLSFVKVDQNKEGFYEFNRTLEPGDIVYGLGETMRGINKRGGRYVSFNSDDPRHRDDMPSMYGAHNFIIVDGQEKFGIFFDTAARVIFDVGYSKEDHLYVRCETSDLDVYLVTGENSYDITKQFLGIIGRSFIPPLWAFGYGQSRWGYKNEKDINKVVTKYHKAQIPLDYVCMDIDYMDRYIDFTINTNRFPDLGAYTKELGAKGIHLVPIVDAGIKIEEGNEVFDEGVKNGYFCTNHEDKNYSGAVWPGMTHFPDFFQPEVREWFGRQYKIYTDRGVEGFWNDMNEPSVFYSEYRKRGIPRKKDPEELFQANGELQDYKDFFHNINGKKVADYDVHNAYGYLMTMASSEGLDKLLDHRFLLFSRSSYIGAHRYGGIWTGDNNSSWHMLRQNVYHMPSLNMCGFLFSGADTGGFGGKATRELLLRWLAVSLFTPLMRNHASKGTKNQECYQFKHTEDFAAVVSLRYRLLPYIYSEYMKAALKQDMYMKPLAFAFPSDAKARDIEDQLMVGESLMMTPVLQEGATGRTVYLPENMTMVRFDGHTFTCTAVEQGERQIEVPLNEVVFFIRKDMLVPVGKAAMNTTEVDLKEVELLGDGKQYEQYIDDGMTREYSLDRIVVLTK